MKSKILAMLSSAIAVSVLMVASTGSVYADRGHHSHDKYDDDQDCPVASPYANGAVSFSQMFGADVLDSLRCNKKREKVKLVVQVNNYCRDSHDSNGTPINNITKCIPGRAYSLGNMKNMINDFEITHGMRRGKDYKMVAVVHSGGGHILRKFVGKDASGNPIPNPYAAEVTALMDKGVEFYFCLNTAAGFIKRGALKQGMISSQLIDGVKYVPAGLNAIVDFQNVGYTYVQP